MLRTWSLRWGLLMGLLLAVTSGCHAQRDRTQSAKYQRKVQMKLQKERQKEQDQAFRNGRKTHWKAQDRSTRKRWRAQRRAAKRMRRGGGPDSLVPGVVQIRTPHPMDQASGQQGGQPLQAQTQAAPILTPYHLSLGPCEGVPFCLGWSMKKAPRGRGFLEPISGLEPLTYALRMRCSTS